MSTHTLAVRLSSAELAWLEHLGEKHEPKLTAAGAVAHLVALALEASEGDAERRAHQLEVYGASGYAEHHPDYPNLPAGLSDV